LPIVREIETGVFEEIIGNPTVDSLDGETRATLETICHHSWTEAERAAFGIYMVDPAETLAGHEVLSRSFQRIDGAVTEVLVMALVTPQVVSPLQMRKALRAEGLMPDVLAFLETQTEEVKEAWEYASEIHRDNELIGIAATALGLSSEQVDDLFRLAATM
jgi:hypothetical protein